MMHPVIQPANIRIMLVASLSITLKSNLLISACLFHFVSICWGYKTKYYRLGGLNNRNIFSHGSGGYESKIKVLTGLISSEVSLLGFQMDTLLLLLPGMVPLCLVPLVSVSPNILFL